MSRLLGILPQSLVISHGRELTDVDQGNTFDIRIAGIFTIAIVSLIGCFLPYAVGWLRDENATIGKFVRSFAAGIILGLSFVHVLPESIHVLEDLHGAHYDGLGGAIALFAVVLCIVAQTWPVFTPPTLDATSITVASSRDGLDLSQITTSPPKVMDLTPEEKEQRRIVAHFMEFGCVVHSVIIGIALGVNTSNRSQAVALFIALCFHQFLEGLALSNIVLRARFSGWKPGLMMLLYSSTASIGIAIGVGVATTFEDNNQVHVGVAGVFDALAGGLLIYIAFVNLIVPEFFKRPEPMEAPLPPSVRLLTYVGVCLGAGLMCVIAYWA